MDTAMRDLDQIEERNEGEGPGRKAAMLAMAGLATVALVFAMGVILGHGGEPEAEGESDPLAALDQAAALQRTADRGDEAEAADAAPEVRPEDMTFHDTLTATDERPEVEAALAAAAAEQQHPDPIAPGSVVLPTSTVPVDDTVPAIPAPAPVVARVEPALPPAATLAEAPVRSPIRADVAPAHAGHDGEYTLQVISYTNREQADVFAEALRQRGHEAFVVRAEIPGRSTPYFRVRIGPFETQAAADRYRTTFEQEERMNSYVVRRREE